MNVNLIIDGQIADIDSKVTITIKDSIQNAREPDKVFGAYSNTFLLPATQQNGKIFGRWENEGRLDSWDARYAADAELLINGATWRKGKVRLLSASTRNGKAEDYRVAFTGQTTNLINTLGDDTLEQLDFSSYDHDYTETNVRTGLTTSLSSGAIRYPLITHSTRYFYTTQFEDASTNPLDHTELKPAIQLTKIMDAIETRYSDITWAASGFWDDTNIFSSLYMWCHRAEGDIAGGSEEQVQEVPYSEWSFSSGTDVTPITTYQQSNGVPVNPREYDLDYTVTPNDSSLYDVIIIDETTGVELDRWINQSGTTTFTTTVQSLESQTWSPRLIVKTTDGLASFTVTLTLDRRSLSFGTPVVVSGNYTSTTATFTLNSFMRIQSQIPKMKIIDFLSGLFKMFNLTAYYNDSDEIVVDTLDNFYSGGSSWDLTKYLDVNYSVERIAPYGQIDFKFEDKSSKLAIKWDEEFSTNQTTTYGFNRRYGELSYLDTQQKYDGGTYEINVPFEKMLFERLVTSSSVNTTLHIGWHVNESDEPSVGAPLIMAIENIDTTSYPIRWSTLANSTTYNRPNNAKLSGTVYTINFNAEIDSYDLDVKTNSLFAAYWDNYIGEIYNKQARKYTMTGYLPSTFVQNYSLADEVTAYGIRFRIESMTIDLNTGKASLELRNIPQVLPS